MDYKENVFADEGYNTGNENTKLVEKKYDEQWDEEKKSVKSNNKELTIKPPERNKKKQPNQIFPENRLSGLNLVKICHFSSHIECLQTHARTFVVSSNLFCAPCPTTLPCKLEPSRSWLCVCFFLSPAICQTHCNV